MGKKNAIVYRSEAKEEYKKLKPVLKQHVADDKKLEKYDSKLMGLYHEKKGANAERKKEIKKAQKKINKKIKAMDDRYTKNYKEGKRAEKLGSKLKSHKHTPDPRIAKDMQKKVNKENKKGNLANLLMRRQLGMKTPLPGKK